MISKKLIIGLVFIFVSSKCISQHVKKIELINRKIDSINKKLKFYYKLLDTLVEKPKIEVINQEVYILEKEVNISLEDIVKINLNLIEKNLSINNSINSLLKIVKGEFGIKYLDKVESLFYKLSAKERNSFDGKFLLVYLKSLRKNIIGAKAINFTAKSLNGDSIILDSFVNKKYVLIDFWATWCKPCRDDLPFLKKLYINFKDSGLEIISISKDFDKKVWEKFIKEENIDRWVNIIDFRSLLNVQKTISDNYLVIPIPVKILINKQGLIIGRWKGGGIENQNSILELISKVLNE